MPRLPTVEQLGARPNPRVPGRISPLHLETPKTGQEEAALIGMGEAVKGLGDSIGLLMQKEKQNLDQARLEAATSDYLNGQLDLELNKETGFANVLGGDAVNRPLLD